MMMFLKRVAKNLPTLITAVLLAIAVWILAVTNTDPVERRSYNRPVPIEISSLDPSLVITNDLPDQTSVMLSAPVSLWSSALSASNAVRAIADLSGLKAGVHEVSIKLQINARPVKIEVYSPDIISVHLEQMMSKSFNINLFQSSSPAIGYDIGTPELNPSSATVSGPSSLVNQVMEIRATLDISQVRESIDRDLPLFALDKNGLRINGVSISPNEVNVKQEITQRGGYRNLIVSVITSGEPASGYNLKSISVKPPNVTVFSTDPELVNTLPGFIETQPLNLNGAEADLDVSLPLDVPAGVVVVGESTVNVKVAISPIQGSSTRPGIKIEIIGLLPEYQAQISPDSADVILSGPLPILYKLSGTDVRVILDLSEYLPGTYQVDLIVKVGLQGLFVESILPASIEVEIEPISTETPNN